MIISFVSILLVGVLGGLIPLVKRWTDRGRHAALAFSTGIFLGAVFLHLLPAVQGSDGHDAHVAAVEADVHSGHDHSGHDHDDDAHEGHDHGSHAHSDHDHDAHGTAGHSGHSHGPLGPWLWVLVGVLGVFLVEALLIPGSNHGHGPGHGSDHDDGRHSAVGWAALVGLSVHALTAGVALAAVQEHENLAGVMLLAILAHKGFESFSLASVFGMTGAPRVRILAMVFGFSLITPAGLLLGARVSALLGASGASILTALSAGTFLYVSLCELLPEVFHRRQDGPLKIGLLLIGISAMWYVHAIGGI
ncbi:MAG: ZIP family metal transporter [Planctomycetota bacterium]|nr:ZIP family metal transporter [Planctomycetota bacterium]